MISMLSRLQPAVRALLPVVGKQVQPRRLGHDTVWRYRKLRTNVPKSQIIGAEVMMGLVWYWILFHVWYDWSHLVGDHEIPDPKKWSDRELGIPPDDAD